MSELDRIRSWRDQTRGHFDRKSTPLDSDAVANTIGWWKDVDLLLAEVDRLSEELEEAYQRQYELAHGS